VTDVAVSPAALHVARPRRRMSVAIGVCFLVFGGVVLMSILGTAIAPHDPSAQNFAEILAKPSGAHLLGTDNLGRDVLSRVIAGARTAVFGPLVIAAGSFVFGNLLGLAAGFRGGLTDSVIMRWVDMMWAVPGLLIIIVVTGALHGGYWLAVVLLLALTIPFDTRIVRGATLAQTPRPYVEAARTLGLPGWRIALFHVWPNVSPIAVANTFLVFAGALLGLSGLAFLGLGVPVGTPDWGAMLSNAQQYLVLNPYPALVPGAMIALTAASSNLIGDWIYDLLANRGGAS
jgi:peptide/nickel transport system permease protein